MKFSFSTILALAATAVAAPTVDIMEARQNTLAAQCEAAHGTLYCCAQQQAPNVVPAQSGGLLALLAGLVPNVGIDCLAVVQVLPSLCGQSNTCCTAAPESHTTSIFTGLIQVAPTVELGNICPAVAV